MTFSSDQLGSDEQKNNPRNPESGTSSASLPQTRRSLREAAAAETSGHLRDVKSASTLTTRAAASTPLATSAVAASAVTASPSTLPSSSPAGPATAPRSARSTQQVAAVQTQQKRRIGKPTKRGIISTVVMTAAAALVATMALPAYAFSMNGAFDPSSAKTAALASGQQTLEVDATATDAAVNRDNYQAPTKEDLQAAKDAAAAAAAAAAAQAAALKVAAVSSTTSTAATTASGVAFNPPSGPYSGAAVVAYAMQFVGVVPYGSGASPDTSFGCDGLTQYVFKQFGINIPRTVSNQAAAGTRVSAADAQPGDLMIYSIGHVGIYAGNGMMIDSPDWGRFVEYRPQWGSYYYVRLGI
ncbi:C40 family peptidase [Subtercola sp. PAMC28395]|uniref:C40 family peptidase n=1 Tax=Subtercola sp. PAMC28395 TaxID=2846775 RepID=UPI001C0D814A|nr:C40 family peptidase [Subtercola sp. PAMC28395]QWT23906.1 C40 family peptidase [Subtercola sp. PAMC28395]